MPCTCDGYPAPEPDLHNGVVAELLCKTMQEHEARGEMACFTSEQLLWWEEHKRRDAIRVALDLEKAKTETEKELALSKLTAFEKKLLGLR